MKTFNWEGVNHDGYFLDKLEPIPSALPSFQKLFLVSATPLSLPSTLFPTRRSSDLSWNEPRAARPCASSSARPSTASSVWISRMRSEEHTSELQSRVDLVCRLLLEKKKIPSALPSFQKLFQVSATALSIP